MIAFQNHISMKTKILLQQFLFIKRQSRQFKFNLQIRTLKNRAYYNNKSRQPLIYQNLGSQILASVEKYGERPALISREENLKLTYTETLTIAEKFAIQLKELGLERGEHLGIWAPNTSQWLITAIAAALGDYPLVCLNPALQAPELEYALNKAKVKILLTMNEYGRFQFSNVLNKLIDGGNKFPALQMVIMKAKHSISDDLRILDFDELLSKTVKSKHILNMENSLESISSKNASNLLFTSGTTGKPKAAVLTHFNFVNNAYCFSKSLKIENNPKTICLTVPLFHILGLLVTWTSFLYGSTIVMPSATFNANTALDAIEFEHCNIILGTPTMFVDMLEQQSLRPRNIASLELGFTAGAACSPEIFMQSKETFGLKDLRIGYGLTETTGGIFTHDGTETLEQAMQTVGKLYENLEAKVINEHGETISFGEEGEICVRGFNVMKGYYDDETKTKEVLSTNGWLRLGDQFVLESNGVGRILGRKKDLILRGGENIYPKEIEDVLDTHLSILEAQVIGVPNKRLGEEICAFIRLKPNVKCLTENDIKQFCREKLCYFKIPRYVRLVKEFPKTNTGKIQKFKLRESFQF